MKKSIFGTALIMVAEFTISFHETKAATLAITANTNWSAITGGGGPGGIPNSTDVVNVKNGATLTVDIANAICSYMEVGKTGSSAGNGTLVFNAGSQLTLSGNTGLFTGTSSYTGTIDMTAGGTFLLPKWGGTTATTVFIPGSGTLKWENADPSSFTFLQAITSFNNLVINSSGYTATLGANITITGTLNVIAGTLNTSGSNYSLTVNGNTTIAGTFTANASAIAFGGDFSNSGTFTYGTSTVTFNGGSAQQLLGSSNTSFYNMTLNNASGLTLAPSAGVITTVRNTLTLSSGKITLGAFELAIGAAGVSGSISGASSSNYIITNSTGKLNQYNIGTEQRTSVLYPVGINSTSYTPIALAVSGASTVDNFKVSVSQTVYSLGTSGSALTSSVIDRTWDITEGTPTGSSLTLQPQWNAVDELGSFNRALCHVSHYTAGAWSPQGSDAAASGSDPYTITSNAVTSFSPFAVSTSTILPIELLNFSASLQPGKTVLAEWKTASETNNDYFTVERSRDGINFETITIIDGLGNSSQIHNYSAFDYYPLEGISYYRLKQTDFDGKYSFSDLKAVNFIDNDVKEHLEFVLFPNPSNGGGGGKKILNADKASSSKILVVVYNCLGNEFCSNSAIIENVPSQIIAVDFFQKLPVGVYFVTVTSDNTIYNYKQKLVIQ
ncbi:MAG: T9SS type A sorting domain-containing protein [Bacteroidetes bacterium]|nr:T9SS type A sorting domain-containing protein [Bacteroidota bacterium]